ncbi:MAG: hypothetical protein ACI86C_000740 [Candidatus Latescibacterota bacterium]|jgi:uncharacterized protein (TIGR00661 family)
MGKQKTILVAPLHWGLGHATRCIPIINALLANNFAVVLASDGDALLLLQKEFPKLCSLELPSYNIRYPRKGLFFRLKIGAQLLHITKIIALENNLIEKFVAENDIDGILSDNRFGVFNSNIPSVFLTHQLRVLSGITTKWSSKHHQKLISNFDTCWVPDFELEPSLSGKLGHLKRLDFPVEYVGPLSRMKYKDLPKVYDILIILSGPEPQRTILENKMIAVLKNDSRRILMVQGRVEEQENRSAIGAVEIINFMTSKSLEQAINSSALVITRSGYTSIMDLTSLRKKVFFIPTPGQFEQQYLARRCADMRLAPFCQQKEFTAFKLEQLKDFKGFELRKTNPNFSKLFSLFHGE